MTKRNLHATLRGFWDVETAGAYIIELRARVAELDHAAAATYWLLDVSEFAIQSKAVAEILTELLPSIVADNALIAMVTPSILISMQGQRSAAGRQQHRFNSVEAAEAWLAEMRDAV